MTEAKPTSEDHIWTKLNILESDLEAISSHLLDIESPLTPIELAEVVVRYRMELLASENVEGGNVLDYIPKEQYEIDQKLLFPARGGIEGKISGIRKADTINGAAFQVMEIEFEDGKRREYAFGLSQHALNEIITEDKEESSDPVVEIMESGGDMIGKSVETALQENEDFVYIAGRWFPKALTADFSEGQLNLAEAVLDMAGGGPLSTDEILAQVGGPDGINEKLASFSLDLALQEDERFDEVGTRGVVAWFLKKLEPNDVQNTPLFLRYEEIAHDRNLLNDEMLEIEKRIYDELSPIDEEDEDQGNEVEVRLIFPHWRSGSLPLTNSLSKLFPSAYESPRVRFEFVDAKSGERYPGWVVRDERYVDGLRKWYTQKELMPGSYVKARKGEKAGEIIVDADAHRASKEWVRTALIGADGGVVFALLKQTVQSAFDERMMIYLPGNISALDEAWKTKTRKLETVVLRAIRELTKLSPQQHVHASEIYAVVNVVMRCPPGPILALLAQHASIEHVGHLHFRQKEGQEE